MGAGFANPFDFSTTDQSKTEQTNASKSFTSGDQAGGDLLQYGSSVSVGEGSISGLTLTDLGAQKQANDLLSSGISGILSTSRDATMEALNLADKARQTDVQAVLATMGKYLPWIAVIGGIWFFTRKEKKGAAS